ncbi:hypothetical protein IQ07DRAFT_644635 [Pyrenochaeta sp. DS3sAY3a]|nr:hypothetical protein IQ07DRAFT_644635 [Pyrenochaeta sp. DS3sAY3a]
MSWDAHLQANALHAHDAETFLRMAGLTSNCGDYMTREVLGDAFVARYHWTNQVDRREEQVRVLQLFNDLFWFDMMHLLRPKGTVVSVERCWPYYEGAISQLDKLGLRAYLQNSDLRSDGRATPQWESQHPAQAGNQTLYTPTPNPHPRRDVGMSFGMSFGTSKRQDHALYECARQVSEAVHGDATSPLYSNIRSVPMFWPTSKFPIASRSVQVYEINRIIRDLEKRNVENEQRTATSSVAAKVESGNKPVTEVTTLPWNKAGRWFSESELERVLQTCSQNHGLNYSLANSENVFDQEQCQKIAKTEGDGSSHMCRSRDH